MNLKPNTSFVNLENLNQLSRGDQAMEHKYLKQFIELIPERMEKLNSGLKSEDRVMVRQTLHAMIPQLNFFGVPNVVEAIQKLEVEYKILPMPQLKQMVQDILFILQKALDEVKEILTANF